MRQPRVPEADDAPRYRVEEDLLTDLAGGVPRTREAQADEPTRDQFALLALDPAVRVRPGPPRRPRHSRGH